jgi:hypothetical protein
VIYVNPTFTELMTLATAKHLRLVVHGDSFALGDADYHLHADLMARLTQGETQNYPLEKAYYVERIRGGEPAVVHAYGDNVYQKATNLPPTVEEQLNDLTRLMAEQTPAAPSFTSYATYA